MLFRSPQRQAEYISCRHYTISPTAPPQNVAGKSSLRVRDARGYNPENHQLTYPPASRGRKKEFPNSSLRVRDARGYIPENHQLTPPLSYPPASRGREWNLQIPHSPRAGRTRVRSREPPANPQLSYPPASRGREWIFTIPLSACGTHAGTFQRSAPQKRCPPPAG